MLEGVGVGLEHAFQLLVYILVRVFCIADSDNFIGI